MQGVQGALVAGLTVNAGGQRSQGSPGPQLTHHVTCSGPFHCVLFPWELAWFTKTQIGWLEKKKSGLGFGQLWALIPALLPISCVSLDTAFSLSKPWVFIWVLLFRVCDRLQSRCQGCSRPSRLGGSAAKLPWGPAAAGSCQAAPLGLCSSPCAG